MSFDKFRAALIKSQVKVGIAASYFVGELYGVKIEPPMIPDNQSEQEGDHGDLLVKKFDSEKWHRVEVKGYEVITSEMRMRFPIILLDKKTTWDEKEHKPHLYMLIGPDTDQAVIFDCKNWGETFVHKFKDQMTGNLNDCYVVKPEFVKRIKL